MEDRNMLFDDALYREVRSKFINLDIDPMTKKRRVYFDNAGGAFRLKASAEAFSRLDDMPDCPERVHYTAEKMIEIMARAEEDIRNIFNAHNGGGIITMLTASQVIWSLTGTIVENVPGTNVVTTKLEHPCAYDSARFFAEKTGKEFRAADTNPETGGVDAEAIAKLIDENTCLLSVIYASNISGAILDLPAIVREARKIKPDLHIIVDSVQHAPHGIIDVDAMQLDGVSFAPYKFFGVRGSGIGYASERVTRLPHPRLRGNSENTWKLGSPAPGHYAAVSEIFNYVSWLGSQACAIDNRRDLFVAGMERIKHQERALMLRMLEGTNEQLGLRCISAVKVYFDNVDIASRDFILAIGLEGWDYTDAVREYEKRGIIVFERVESNIYSVRMLNSFGIPGCVRVSPLHCNNVDEIDYFLKMTEEMANMKR